MKSITKYYDNGEQVFTIDVPVVTLSDGSEHALAFTSDAVEVSEQDFKKLEAAYSDAAEKAAIALNVASSHAVKEMADTKRKEAIEALMGVATGLEQIGLAKGLVDKLIKAVTA